MVASEKGLIFNFSLFFKIYMYNLFFEFDVVG